VQVKVVRVRRKSKVYEYARLVRSYRNENGTSVHEVVANLGELPHQTVENLRAAFRAGRQGRAVVVKESAARGLADCGGKGVTTNRSRRTMSPGAHARRLPDVPWITEEGFDPAKYPIDPVLKQTQSDDDQQFLTGCRLLGSMVTFGRAEAVVHLLGLLRWYEDDYKRLTIVVEQLPNAKSKIAAEALANELRRVKSSNTTRRYLDTVITAMTRMPAPLAQPELDRLAADTSFSPKMRAKMRRAADQVAERSCSDSHCSE